MNIQLHTSLPLAVALLAPATAHALDLSASGPALRGARVTLRATGATPGQVVTFVYGPRAGVGPCLPALGGVCLGVVQPTALGARAANAQGVATLPLTVPVNAPLADLVLQAVQGGVAPAASPVVGTAVVQILPGLVVQDAATLRDARYALEIQGDLTFSAGYPAVVDLPHLERVTGGIYLQGSTPLQLSAPALVETHGLFISVGAGGPVEASFAALVVSDNISTYGSQDDVTLHLPALTQFTPGTGQLTFGGGGVGTVRVDAAALTWADHIQANGPNEVILDFPALESVNTYVQVQEVANTVIDGWFPSLTTIGVGDGDLTFERNHSLVRIGAFGAPGLDLGLGQLGLTDNPILTDVSGLFGISAASTGVSLCVSLPSCVARDLIVAVSGRDAQGALIGQCIANAVDTCSDQVGPSPDDCWY